MTTKTRYTVTAPVTPGATPSTVGTARTLRDARVIAKRAAAGRRDLTGQDVRIDTADGMLVEYAGPAR